VTTRRTFLRGVAGLAGAGLAAAATASTLAGCDVLSGGGGDPSEPHQWDALLAATVALGDQYDEVLSAVPALSTALTPVRDAHRAHAQALAEAIGTPVPAASPVPTAPPADRSGAIAYLVAAERAGRDAAVAACVEATPRLAPLLGSIAAARASHLEVLR
jgi:hypothetical protein